jgi:DNA-binding MurR/RpiR family transcriptional regulator
MSLHPDFAAQQEDVFARLRMGIKNLPTQQKQICTYILENHQQVSFYTVEELANASKTSPATVVRTVKRIGYDSYKDLLEDLQKVLMSSNNAVWWEIEQMWTQEGGAGESEPVLSWAARDDIEGIKSTLTPQLMDSFDKAVDLMDKARNIGVFGMRSSKYIAGFLHFMLNQLFSNVHTLACSGEDTLFDELLNYGKEDLIVAISLGGPHFVVRTHNIVAYAKENNIPTILITNDLGNQAIDNASVSLCVGRTRYHYSIVPPLMLVEALVVELGLRKKHAAQRKLHRLEKLLDENGITLP